MSATSWKAIPESLWNNRSKHYIANIAQAKVCFAETEFDQHLSPLLALCPNLHLIVAALLSRRLPHKSWSVSSQTSSNPITLQSLSEEDAYELGLSFRRFLVQRKESATAVDSWRLANPLLQPLFDITPYFNNIICELAKLLVIENIFGLKLRVFIGAAFSIGDLITDLNVIYSYNQEGKTKEAGLLLSMILTAMFFQILIVTTQNIKSKHKIFKEILFILLFLKPPLDAYRVVYNQPDEQSAFSPLQEMVASKWAELACESIPGCLLQIVVLITSPQKTGLRVTSIMLSSLTTGFASATISFDMDSSVDQRRKTPAFYGYLPDSNDGRAASFIVMLLLASLHNISRSIGVALLYVVSAQSTFLLLGAEMTVYHLVKLFRSDYTLFVPGIEGGWKIAMAIVFHIVIKIICDFTGMIHVRGAKLIGGYLFCAITIYSQLLPFFSMSIYNNTELENKIPGDELRTLLTVFAIAWVNLMVLFFFFLIKREYWHTFVDTTTAWQATINQFRSADDAYLKMNAIFANHISFTQRIKPEVVDYLSEHWEEWVADENNEWFTTGFRRGIPDSYIPQRVLVLYGETENKKRRRRGSSNSLARVFQLDSNSDSSMDSNGE